MITEHRMRGAVAVLVAAMLWGTVGPAHVLAGSTAGPGALGSGRLLIGGLILMVPIAHRFPLRALLGRGVLAWVVVAAASTALFQTTFLYAIDRTGAALGTTVALGCAPFATGIFAWWWMKNRPTRRWLVATMAAVLGCIVILAPTGTTADGWGIGLAVVSGCCYGAYTAAAKVLLGTGLPLLVTIAPTLVLGGIMLTPFVYFSSSAEFFAPSTLTFLGWSGLVGTAIAYASFAYGLNLTTAATAGTLSLAEPLAAAALGILVLGESLTALELTGSLILITGLIIVSMPTQRRQRPSRTSLLSPASPERELLERP